MSNQGSYFQRDRSWHPAAFAPQYKTSVLRSPRYPLLSLDNTISEMPARSSAIDSAPRQRSHPQLRQDGDADRPAHHRLWPCARRERRPVSRCAPRILAGHAGGRYRRRKPISPPSIRISADADARSPMPRGATRSHHQAGRLSLAERDQRLAPGAYPFLGVRPRLRPAAHHANVFPGRSDDIGNARSFTPFPSKAAIEQLGGRRLIAKRRCPMDALAFTSFDIVLRGRRATIFENRPEGN